MKKLLFLTLLAISLPFTAQQLRTLPEHVPVREREQAFIPQRNLFARPVARDYLMEDFNSGIPAAWQVIDSAGTGAVWTAVTEYNGQTIDGTPFVIADSDGAGNVDMDTYLESPVITINNNGAPVYLSFDHIFSYYSGNEKGDVEVFDGTSWVLVQRYEGNDVGAWDSPAHEEYEVTDYINPYFKVRFHYYDAHYDWYWALDNVRIYSLNADDLSLQWGIPGVSIVNEETYFSTIVYNEGYRTQDVFNVSVEVFDSSNNLVHNETVYFTSADLNSREYLKVNFSNSWTPGLEGNYYIRYTVNLTGDEDTENNIYEINNIVKSFRYESSKIYSFVAFDGDNNDDENDLGYFDPAHGVFTSVDSLTGIFGSLILAGDFADIFDIPTLVASDNWNVFYFIDGTGEAYYYGYVPFLEDVITGVAFRDNGPPYFSTLNSLYMLTPYLDTLKIGDYNIPNPNMIGLGMDASGNLYGIDLTSAKLYSINTSDASLTEIGDLGMSINYAQDIGYDRENDILYGTLFYYDSGTGNITSGLYDINTSSGQATLIGSGASDEYTLCAFAPSDVLNSQQLTATDWRIYPVPAQDELNVHWKILPDSWEIFDAKEG